MALMLKKTKTKQCDWKNDIPIVSVASPANADGGGGGANAHDNPPVGE